MPVAELTDSPPVAELDDKPPVAQLTSVPPNTNPNPRPLAGKIADFASKVIGDPSGLGVAGWTDAFSHPVATIAKVPPDTFQKQLINIPKSSVPKGSGIIPSIGAGVSDFLSSLVEGLSTPENIGLLATGGLGEKAAQAVSAKFLGQMAANAPEQAAEVGKKLGEGDKAGATSALLNYAMGTLLPAAAVHPAVASATSKLPLAREEAAKAGVENASKISKSTSLPVQPLREGVGESAPLRQQGEAAPAQAQKEAAPLKQPEFALKPEHKAALDETVRQSDIPVEYHVPTDPNEPFAGLIAQPNRAKGTIVINPKELSAWLDTEVPKGKEAEAIRSLLSEESIHSRVTDEQAQAYHDTLTAAEKALGRRIYGQFGKELSSTMLGHEMLRMRLQQLARIDVRETLQRSLRERWSVKSMLALNDAIRGIRESLGTDASKEGLAILDKVQENLDAALRKNVPRGTEPSARRRKDKLMTEGQLEEEHDRLAEIIEKNPNDTEAQTRYDLVLKRMLELEAERQGRNWWDEPGARRRKPDETAEFFLPPVKEGDTSRPSATELGASERPAASITTDDIDWKTPEAYKPIDPELLDKPYSLGRYLTKGARVAGSKTATQSKAVVALEKNGKVDVVHIYQDPDDLAMVQRPTAIGQRVHSSIRDILADGYKPIGGYLLNEPTEKFHQHFDSVEAFRKQFGEPAETQALKTRSYEPPPAVQEAQVVRPMEYATAAEYEPGTLEGRIGPVTDAEAASIIDHIAGAHDFSPGGVRAALESLRTTPNRQALSGFRKLAARIGAKYPNLSTEQLVDKLAQQIHETHRDSKDFEDFIGRTVAQGPARRGQTPVSIPKSQTAETGASELQAGERSSPIEHAPTIPFTESPPRTKTGEIDLDAIRKKSAEAYPLTLMRDESAPAYRPAKSTGIETEIGKPEAREGEQNLGLLTNKQLQQLGFEGSVGNLQKMMEPGARRRHIENQYEGLKKALAGAVARHVIRQEIPRLLDGADQIAKSDTAQAGEHIRLASSKPLRQDLSTIAKKILFRRNKAEAKRNREAAMFYIASGKTDELGLWSPNEAKLDKFEKQLNDAATRARLWRDTGTLQQKLVAPKYQKAVARYQEALNWARDHWKDKPFVQGAEAYRQEMANHIQYLNSHGVTVAERENYIPGLYEGDFWADGLIDMVTAPRRLLGEQFRVSKKFNNPIDAIEAGPYWLASMDVADLAEHRILQGHRMAERAAALDVLRVLKDPSSGEPVAKPVNFVKKEVTDKFTGETHTETIPTSPDPFYELITPRGMRSPLAIRRPYTAVVESTLGRSGIPSIEVMNVPVGKMALSAHNMLKHGIMTLIDTFHPSRIIQYALASMGKDAGYQGGYAATHYRPQDLDAAVSAGYVPKEAADWAKATVNVKTRRGEVPMTRHQIARDFLANGLMASRNADALYKDAVRAFPIMGEGYHRALNGYNTWLFDRLIPGLMQESAVRNFEKYNKENPNIPYDRMIKDVARDTNFFFANLGRQGLFRNATLRDMMQMTFFAPSWAEGLLQKEFRFLGRASGLSTLAGARKGLPTLGTLGGAVARGMGAYLIGAQIVNLISRHKFTFQNPEKDHKWDAYLPVGDHGVWMSPFAVFGEVTDELIRVMETKSTVWKAIAQLGENRLGPLGKMEQIIRTGESPQGQKYTTTAGQIGGALGAITPFSGVNPLSFGALTREAGHAIAPNSISPNAPGRLARQIIATGTGVKTMVGETHGIQISRMADDYVKKNHLKPETGWQEVQTDEPSYTKLRSALRIGDMKEAAKQFAAIRNDHTDKQIYHGMKLWSSRPFTGSSRAERQFISSLDDHGLETYFAAVNERQQLYQRFLDFVFTQP